MTKIWLDNTEIKDSPYLQSSAEEFKWEFAIDSVNER